MVMNSFFNMKDKNNQLKDARPLSETNNVLCRRIFIATHLAFVLYGRSLVDKTT